MQDLLILAQVEAESKKDIFGTLGIDWTLLLIQALAFLVLMWFLGKYVYPPITRMLEKRDADIEQAAQLANEAEAKAQKTEAKIDALLKQAKIDAAQIVTTAKDEAAGIVESAEKKSQLAAERITREARDQIDKEVEGARKMLHNETIDLVTMVTEKVTSKTISSQVDDQMIASSIKEVKS